jgi:hypothetical protein
MINTLTDAERERLAKLGEEANEISHVIYKILLWGYDSYHPRDPDKVDNRTLLENEIGDFVLIMRNMQRLDDINGSNIFNRSARKAETINNYLQHNKFM